MPFAVCCICCACSCAFCATSNDARFPTLPDEPCAAAIAMAAAAVELDAPCQVCCWLRNAAVAGSILPTG